MKKLLTFLTLLTLFFGVGWAADYVKVTSTSNVTDGTYLIVYESDNVAFNGGLSKLDATSNTINVTISNNKIASSSTVDAAAFTLTYIPASQKFSVKSASGLYIGQSSYTNGLVESEATVYAHSITIDGSGNALMTVNTDGGDVTLKYNDASNQNRFRYYKSGQKSIQLYKLDGGTTPEPTTYSITGTGAVTGGSVTASATSNITAGTSITITATPNTGYELSNLTVDNTDVTSSVSNNQYTFSMPAHDVAVSATFTEQSVTPTTDITFERITSTSDLEAGKRYILVYETTPAGMGAITNNTYGASVTGSTNLTVTNGVATLPSGSTVKPLTLGGNATDGWTFDLDGALLNHTGSSNTLTTGTSNTTWAIAFSGNNATITNKTNTTRVIKYNSSSPRFACYTSGQQAIQLYKEVESTTSNNLYLIGKDMNSQSDWNISTGPQFTYSNSAGTYAVDAYFDMASRGYFQFVEGLSDSNSNWGGLTGRYYASGSSDVAVDTYDMDGTVPLYFTNSTDYSPGQYAFTVPAGIYTIVVDKTNWKIYVTQHEVTMEISPNSATFETTKNVTLSSNLTALGGKIYYTTDGSTPSASNGTEYTGTITLEATTTIKAIAILNYIQSEVAEKTYIKTPAAPVITPASCTFNEPLTVTITAESGADIYYTLDGSNPTDESTLYTGPFTVSTTTTVKAKAYVNGVYGATAEATYTYSNVQPSTGDFELVTSADQLVAGNEYIILEAGGDYAMGAISNSKGQPTDDYTLNGTLGASGSTVSAGSGVNVLTLGGETGAWTLQQSDNSYISISGNNTNVTSSSSSATVTIAIDNNNYATIQGYSTRQILYSISNEVFGNYATSNAGGSSYEYVYLYTRASNAVQNPVFSPVPGIYNVDIDVTISCATNGATIYYTTDGTDPTATTGTQYTGEIIVSESTTFKAIAVKDGNSSSVVTATYTINKNTEIATVTLDYREPFTAGIGDFTIDNVSGFSPVWSLDGNFGVKGTAYSPNTVPTNNAAVSRLVSPIIDMTGAVQPELSFSHQINKYFTDVNTQCQVFIRETTDGTDGTWIQLPITFGNPTISGGWTNDVVDIDLSDYADKKVQISFLYTNPTEGTGAGTWEIQNFVVADNSEYHMVNNIAEFLALENGTKAKFRNPVTVLYDYAQYSSNSYHEYIWVKDNSGYMQFYIIPTLNSDANSGKDGKAAFYENGDIIPAGFVVTKNYYENGKFVQAYSTDALNAGFEQATHKGLADPEFMDFDVLDDLDASNTEDVATWCNHYITLEKIKLTSSSKNFNFQDENGTTNSCVGYNKYNGDGSLLKDGTTSADVIMPTDLTKFYNVKGIIQLWQGGWEFMPIEFTEWKEEEMTLRTLCQDGVVNHDYKISNNLLGAYASADGTKLWVKDDDGQAIVEYEPDATYKDNFAIEYNGNTRLEQAHYDQSNWCMLIMADENAGDFVGKIIKGGSIEGRFTDKTNPTLDGVSLTEEAIYSNGSYAPNYYIPANFYGNQKCHTTQYGQDGHGDFFFMTPKPQEYAMVVWAVWDSENEQFIMSTDPHRNTHMFEGGFSISFELNTGASSYTQLQDGYGYDFQAIIRKQSSTTGAKATGDFVVYPLDLDEGQDPVTSINDINAGNGEVKSVKYVNVAGIVSDVPFQGVNIVVTEYTDGSRTTTKMLRK